MGDILVVDLPRVAIQHDADRAAAKGGSIAGAGQLVVAPCVLEVAVQEFCAAVARATPLRLSA